MADKQNFQLIKNDKVYDFLRWMTQIVLPASATLYFTLAALWNFPHVEQILGTVAAVEVFLGALLGISKKQYDNQPDRYDGDLVVDTSTGETYLAGNEGLDKVAEKQDIKLRIQKS